MLMTNPVFIFCRALEGAITLMTLPLNQPDNGEVFVQTITRFLHELKSSNDCCLTSSEVI